MWDWLRAWFGKPGVAVAAEPEPRILPFRRPRLMVPLPSDLEDQPETIPALALYQSFDPCADEPGVLPFPVQLYRPDPAEEAFASSARQGPAMRGDGMGI